MSFIGSIDYGAMLYRIILLTFEFFRYLRRHHQDEMQKSELQRQLAEAQLQALKMQLHPHFLFNALHSISELKHDNPRAADRMVARLSELLRIFLSHAETQEVPLRREVEIWDAIWKSRRYVSRSACAWT